MASIPRTDRYRPHDDADAAPPTAPLDVLNAMYEFQGNRQARGRPPRNGDFTFRRPPRARMSDRPLLTEMRASTPDPIFRGGDTNEKFRQVDDLTDPGDEDMDVSRSDYDEERPLSKRQRSGPSWSNPDPYTALPPIAETQKKKQDVVRLIRRSRVTPPASQPSMTMAGNGEDFISLDMGDGLNDVDAEERNAPPDDAPTGPKSRPSDGTTQLGKRKRDPLDDISKLPPRASRNARLHQRGKILGAWIATDLDSSTPWYRPPTAPDEFAGVSLHQEILDFYEWVKPQDFEQDIRLDVISRLQKTFSNLEPRCQLKSFGSFAAGLYLPTGDMDLVLMTNRSYGSRFPSSPKGLLFFIRQVLEREGIAVPGSLQAIAGAKVPIIKFVDALTGLKVDLSFNNDSGVVANNTFMEWKARYPAMPILVSIVKQYLMIRGLNDVAFGGLGGFSTICLVTSVIQHQVPAMQVPNLGNLLCNFFYFYGYVFNKQDIAIRLEPPGFVRKDKYEPFFHNPDRPNRLAIVDPNRADNNISGGTAEIDLVFKCFQQAYKDLLARMIERGIPGQTPKSLLVDLLGADFNSYGLQRERLRRIYSNQFAQNKQALPPVVSLKGPPGVALPNDIIAGSTQHNQVAMGPTVQTNGQKGSTGKDKAQSPQKLTKTQRRLRAAKERAERLRKLRPDIGKIGKQLTADEAIKLGGYETLVEMDKDLADRARKMSL